MNFKSSNKNWVLLGTAIIIGIVFSGYFLVYVKDKEKDMISNNFRVLQQVVKNIKSLEISYLKNAISLSKSPVATKEVNDKLNERVVSLEEYRNITTSSKPISVDGDTVFFNDTGIYFYVANSDTLINEKKSLKLYFTYFDDFFSNELFQRKDVFDQIIITKVQYDEMGGVSNRKILFSNEPIGILDSTFYKKTIRQAKDELLINDNLFVSFNQKIDRESNVFISGLVLKSKFEQQKRSVSPFVIFTLSIALMLIILAMPMIKLKIMSTKERLYIQDVIFSVMSILIGPAVFMVFLYTSLTFFGNERAGLESNLQKLSKKIESNFQLELQRIVYQFIEINDRFPDLKNSPVDISNRFILRDSLQIIEELGKPYQEINNSSKYAISNFERFGDVGQSNLIEFKHLKAMFMANDNAQNLAVFSTFYPPGYAQDLSHRKYLTNIINNKPDLFKDNNSQVYPIAIESIKSVNDGAYEIGVGMATGGDNLPVIAISAKLGSVMDPILEVGYGFCIIDKSGNTLFHSDIKKNMNENFLMETNGIFNNVINSHVAAFESTIYNGKSQNIMLRPLDCLKNHYIATFVDSEVYYGPFTLSMVTSFSMYLSYLLLIITIFIVLYYTTFRGSKLKQTVFMLNFLRPYETEPHFNLYRKLNVVFAFATAYLILSSVFLSGHYDFLLVDILAITTSLLFFSYYRLSKLLPESKVMLTTFSQGKNPGFKAIAILIGISMICRLAYFIYLGEDVGLVVMSIVSAAIILFIIMEIYGNRNFFNLKYWQKEDISIDRLQRTFKVHVFLWVIILSIIPINQFLRITYEKEKSIFDKYRSLELLSSLQNWSDINQHEFSDKFKSDDSYQKFVLSRKSDNIHLAVPTDILGTKDPKTVGENHGSFLINKIYKRIRPKYNTGSEMTRDFLLDMASDTSWRFKTDGQENIFVSNPKFHDGFEFNSVTFPKVNFFAHNWVYIFMITVLSIFILVKFLSFTLNKIYGFGYKKYARNNGKVNSYTFDRFYLKPESFSKDSSYNNIFIVAVNSSNTSHITNYLKAHFSDNFLMLDFHDFDKDAIGIAKNPETDNSEIPNMDKLANDWEKIKYYFDKPDQEVYVLIDHFEFGYNDFRMNKLKLNALKQIVDCNNIKVLISSEINATKLLNHYEESINKLSQLLSKPDVGDRITLQEQMDDLRIDYKKWQQLLGNFVKCVIPINRYPNEDELSHGEYLDMVSKYLENRNVEEMATDDKILTVQQMSHPYYFSIWNALSKDERYIVYDIAKDKFVNTINTNGILSLLDKGILVYDHSLRIMNESFANFVITKVKSDEALEIEMESRKKGTWNTTFGVIILLIVSLIIFLAIGQKNFLNDINAFLTSIAALIGLLIRFSGFLSFGGKASGG